MTWAGHTRPGGAARRGGMTLVEIMLAIGIVVMMMGGVYAFYSGALATRERITAAAERIAAVRAVMGRMTRELRGAMVFTAPRIVEEAEAGADAEGAAAGPTDLADIAAGGNAADITNVVSRLMPIGVSGGSDEVEFPTVCLPGPSAWARDDSIAANKVIQAASDVELVGYRLRPEEDDAGNVIGIVGLERSRKKEIIVSGPYEDEDENTEWALVSPHIKFLRVQYWNDQGGSGMDASKAGTEDEDLWVDIWGGGDMPKAVRVTLGFKPLPEDYEPEEYPYETFSRVIYIPGASSGFRAAPPPGGGAP